MIIVFRTIIFRAVLFGLLWWILTDGAMTSWYVGVPTIVLATLASVALLPAASWSITGVARFVPFFIYHSLRGGADVAWRAFHPGLPIDPDTIEYALGLPPGRPLVFLVTVINLLPGTLSAAVTANTLQVHVLTRNESVAVELIALERLVARIFGVSLQATNAGEFDAKV